MSLLAHFGIGQRPALRGPWLAGCWTHTGAISIRSADGRVQECGRSVFVRHIGMAGRS